MKKADSGALAARGQVWPDIAQADLERDSAQAKLGTQEAELATLFEVKTDGGSPIG